MELLKVLRLRGEILSRDEEIAIKSTELLHGSSYGAAGGVSRSLMRNFHLSKCVTARHYNDNSNNSNIGSSKKRRINPRDVLILISPTPRGRRARGGG